MRARWAWLAVLGVGACEPPPATAPRNDAEPRNEAALRQALPRAADLAVHVPGAAQLAPEQATFYGFTRGVALNVNGMVWAITHVVADATAQPATRTDGATYAVWGPYHDALSPATWRVRVDRTGEGTFRYLVDGWPKDAGPDAAVPVLEGTYAEGAPESGGWTYHLTAAHALDAIGQPSTGEMTAQWTLGAPRVLEVSFDHVQGPQDPLPNTARYRYAEGADGAGTLDFIANLDVHADSDPRLDRRELVEVRSRWLGDGSGRSDVVAVRGDLPPGERVDLVECWDAAFLRTFVSYGYADQTQADGDAAACPFADRQAPAFEGFDAATFPDGDLVAALPGPADVSDVPAPVADPVERPADYYVMARDAIANLGAQVRGPLDVVRGATRYPGDCDAGGCVWGPWNDAAKHADFRVAVRPDGDGYAFDVATRPEGGDWSVVLHGGYAGGDGWLVLDFDALAAADPSQTSRGTYRAEWSRDGAARRLAVSVSGYTDADIRSPVDTRYLLQSDADGGRLDLDFPANVDGHPALERIEAALRWRADGAGTGDARVTGGDVPAGSAYLGVQCWDAHAALTHADALVSAPGQDALPRTDATCAFADWQDAQLPND
jgi:hypothetical protein